VGIAALIASTAATVNHGVDRELEALVTGPGGLVFAVVMGLLWGSFANVCIYRWPPSPDHPKGQSVVRPGSHCFACGAPVRWYDNVPLLSFLWLRGRCRACGTRFSARYLWVEALTGALFGLIWWQVVDAGALFEPVNVRLLRWFVVAAFALVLVVITFIDLDHKLILDKVTYPAIPAFYLLGLALPGTRWWDGLLGAALGYGIIRAVSDGYYHLTGREGLGYGDGKLLAIVGALVGWRGVVFTLFGGSVIGSVMGLAAAAVGRRGDGDAGEDEAGDEDAADAGEDGEAAPDEARGDREDDDEPEDDRVSIRHMEVPFGPFLAAAAMFYVLAEPWLRVRLSLFH
jgi:leader peptidase (prepilin peptidase) / N-methyltransferase